MFFKRSGSTVKVARRRLAVASSAVLFLLPLGAPAPVGASAAAPVAGSAGVAAASQTFPVDVAVGDFNGDRNMDVVEAMYGRGLTVRYGTGPASFGDPVELPASRVQANRVLAVDVTADGRPDIVAFAPGGDTFWVVASTASGFADARSTKVPGGIQDIAVADFDRDGARDVAIASRDASQIVIAFNRSDRKGFDLRAYPIQAPAISLRSVKLDRDGRPDLAVGLGDNSVVALVNSGVGFDQVSRFEIDFAPDFMATGDLNADGWDDVVVASKHGVLASLYRQEGALGVPVESVLSAPLTKIELGFIDDDGYLDVIGSGSATSIVFPGLDSGRFDSPRQAIRATDVKCFTLARTSGGRQAKVVLGRESGISVDTVTEPVSKLRGGFTVTTAADTRPVCPGYPATESLLSVPGSLRDAIDQANTAGGGVIMFDLPIIDSGLSSGTPITQFAFRGGGYSEATLTWHIVITDPLVIQSNVTISGESQQDTNPFGPDVVIQPLDIQAWTSALEDEAPDPPWDTASYAFDVQGNNNEISNLIIAGNNFGGFPTTRISMCSDATMSSDVAYIANFFSDAPIILRGSGNIVRGCFLNTNQRGVGTATPLPVGPFSGGVAVLGSGNRVGGDSIQDRNIIVSSTDGVLLSGGSGNMVVGNIIGTDGTIGGRPGGATPLHGVLIFDADESEIRNNTIGGSSLSGILITNGSSGTDIAGNRIGVDSLGSGIVANSDGGVLINGGSMTTVGPANIISNNGGVDAPNSGGVVLTGSSEGSQTTGTTVSDNTIEANAGSGVYVQFGSMNTVGPNNTIDGNGQSGVSVVQGTRNKITENSIFGNGRLGIDLVVTGDGGTGITPNDDGDADTGPNNVLNFPIFTSSTINSTQQAVVAGTAPANSTVEIFSSDVTHANGEGQTFITSTTATASGTFSAVLPLTLPLPGDLALTGTATDGTGNTSEFGPNFTLNSRFTVDPAAITFPTTAVGGSTSRTVTVTNVGVANLTVTGAAISPTDGPFTVTGLPAGGAVLTPGASVTLTVTFAPTSESNFSGSLVISTDVPDAGTATIPLGGTAIQGRIEVSPATVVFDPTPVGGSRTAVVTVRNTTPVPVTVTRIDFLRRNSRKVTFTDRNDPFFSASAQTLQLPANGSVDVQIVFQPEAPIKTPDKSSPFELPDPSYQTPKKMNTDLTFVVSDQLGISVTVPIKAKVRPVPGITGGNGDVITSDELALTLNVYDPDNNVNNARFVFYNESFVELFHIDDTPGVNKAIRKFAKGMNVPLKFTFTGVEPFMANLKFIDAVVSDGSGQTSDAIRFRLVTSKIGAGKTAVTLIPISAPYAYPASQIGIPGIELPPIQVAPRQ